MTLVPELDARGRPLVIPALAVTGASLDIHNDEADELLGGLEQLEKALRLLSAQGDLNVPLCLRVMALAVTAWRSAGQVSRRAGSRSGPEPARMLTVIGRRHLEAH